jgi:hypothetical protein
VNNILINGATVQFHGVWTQSGHYGARNIIVGAGPIYGSCCFTGDVPSQVKANVTQWDSNCVYNSANPGSPPFMAPWNGKNQIYSWSQWTAAGLDAHTKVADPLFTDVNKTWPNYQPKGDYTVKAGSPALALGFKNFPMDSFGVMPVGPVATRSPWSQEANRAAAPMTIKFSLGRLYVNHDGEYRVIVLTALGRTVETFQGKGRTCFNIDTKSLGAGVYLAKVLATDAEVTQRFVVK